MAAPSNNGVFVVTQYIPAASSSPVLQGSPACQTPYFLQKFIKGEPKTLGVVQIMIGFISICLGGILCSNYIGFVVVSGVPFWGAVFYFISGGLSISAEKKGTRSLVTGSLVMNVLSSFAAGISFILCSLDLTVINMHNSYYRMFLNVGTFYPIRDFKTDQGGVVGVLLLFSLLEISVSVAVFVFGCKSVCNSSSPLEAQPLFMVQSTGTQDPRVLPMQAAGVPLAQGVTIGQGMPVMQGMPVPYGISTMPAAQDVTSAHATAPPPSYYKEVPGDIF